MRQKPLLLLIIILSSYISFSQEDEDKVFEKVEIIAGTNEKEWNMHIQRYSKLPDSIQQKIPEGTYKVNVEFVIDKFGSLGSVKAKNNPGYDLDKIAEKIIRAYKGKWRPASQCGRDVRAYRT